MIADSPTSGRYVMTNYVHDWAFADPARLAWIVACFERHESDDWGDLDADDRHANRDARNLGSGRIMSVYPVPAEIRRPSDGAWRSILWVITDDIEDPDSYTTMLFPSEY